MPSNPRNNNSNLIDTQAPRGLRIPDAARYMGLPPWTVEELVRSQKLPALKLSRHYTILREDADAFLDAEKGQK